MSTKWRFSQNPLEKPVVSRWLKVSKFRTSHSSRYPCVCRKRVPAVRSSGQTPLNIDPLKYTPTISWKPLDQNEIPVLIYGWIELCTIVSIEDKTENGILTHIQFCIIFFNIYNLWFYHLKGLTAIARQIHFVFKNNILKIVDTSNNFL